MLLMYNEDMKVGGMIIGGVCAILVSFISVHLFLDPAPEMRVVESSDGVIRIDGRVYRDADFFLEEAEDVARFPLNASRYTLLPEDAVFIPPFLQLSFFKESAYPALYFWNKSGAYWIPVPRFTHEDERVYFPVAHGGVYALGEHFAVEAPTFIDVLSELRTKLPADAVSYDVSLIASVKDGVPVLVQSGLERGGCGGVPVAYEESVVAEDQRTVQVLVNDVLTETHFTFLMQIGTTSEGCPEDMPMQVIF